MEPNMIGPAIVIVVFGLCIFALCIPLIHIFLKLIIMLIYSIWQLIKLSYEDLKDTAHGDF